MTAQTILENQRSALRNRIKGYLTVAYGLSSQPSEGVDSSHGFTLKDHFRSLYKGFDPRPPAAGRFDMALTELLDQALTFQFPAHPAFSLENEEIRVPKLKKVWQELQRILEAPDDRCHVDDKAQRVLLRQIATPLELGDVPENYFVVDRHWITHFNRRIAEHKPHRLTVRNLYEWMDDPQPTGLPDLIRNLVVLFFAEKENRSFTLHGKIVTPDVDGIRPEMELVLQKLPSEEVWNAACKQAKLLFGVTPPRICNGANLAHLAEDVRSACPKLEENAALARELERVMHLVGVPDPEETPRLKTAREMRDIVSAVESARDELDLAERLAELEPTTGEVVLRKSARTAGEIGAELRRLQVDLFRGIDALQDERREKGQAILEDLRQALSQDEQATALLPALKKASADAIKLLTVVVPPPQLPPPEPEPPPKKNRKLVSKEQRKAVSAKEARLLLEALQSILEDDAREVDISWTVWEREGRRDGQA
jgi:hypothetical protein